MNEYFYYPQNPLQPEREEIKIAKFRLWLSLVVDIPNIEEVEPFEIKKEKMPEISRFLGIIITMYCNDHPPPHFQVRYNQQKAIIDIETLSILQGKLSPRVLGIVIEWASLYQEELRHNWQLARQNKPLETITPLE